MRTNLRWPIARILALLALAACAAPAVIPPTAAPPQPATATALPPAAAVTPRNTPAPIYIPVPATTVSNLNPGDIAFDIHNNIYVSDCMNGGVVYQIDPKSQLTIYAGSGRTGYSGDGGPARAADLGCPDGLAFDQAGNLYVADPFDNRIRRVSPDGLISTVVGNGPINSISLCCAPVGGFGGDGGPAGLAQLNTPTNIAFDAAGNLYIADTVNDRIRKVDKNGIITTVAGNGTVGFSGDGGPATAAELDLANFVWAGMAFDTQGNLYLSDTFNARIRKIDPQGIITTIAGTGQAVVAGDGGPAVSAALSRPTGLAFDASGNLYIACVPSSFASDTRIRKIDTHGVITTVAGTGPVGFSGDGGPAVAAALSYINGIKFDLSGNLYVADAGNQRVRRVDTNGIITTVAGGAP